MATNILNQSLLLGQIIPSNCLKGLRVRVPTFVYNDYLKMYFKKEDDFEVSKGSMECKVGDTVIIKSVHNKLGQAVGHKIVDLVYKFGDMIDPVSGEPVIGSRYRSQNEKAAKLYGKNNSDDAYEYDKAPSRGWQEAKRDFSDKPTYNRWNDFAIKDPYGLDS